MCRLVQLEYRVSGRFSSPLGLGVMAVHGLCAKSQKVDVAGSNLPRKTFNNCSKNRCDMFTGND